MPPPSPTPKKPPRKRPLSVDDRLRALVRTTEAAARQSEADRDRLSRLEAALSKDRVNNENHRRNTSRVLENSFAASLPRVMAEAHDIVIAPEDVRVRVRKGRKRREYDFIAPNGEVVLVGEVKTRFRLGDVNRLARALLQFRVDYPEYAGLKLYGVVAGGAVDDDALADALDAGFIVLRMEGAEVHPATAKNYTPTPH